MTDSSHRPLRILLVIEALTVGGAEQMLVAMANALSARGHDVHLFCLQQKGELADQLSDSVALKVFDKSPGFDWRLAGRIRSAVKRIDPQVINSHLWVANSWTRLSLLFTGYPIVVTEHSRDSWKSSLYRRVDRFLSRRTQQLVAVSADTARFYRDDVGIPDALISVINNGVDTASYAAGNGQALRQQWLAGGGTRLIGTVGRLVPAKNHGRLLNAMSLLTRAHPDWRLVVVGDGPERAAIEALRRELDLQDVVILAGNRLDIPDVLAALDVFVLSSDREGHPLTALEAQAAACAVVLTDVGGCADAIAGLGADAGGEVGGRLVEPAAAALADGIDALMRDETQRAETGRFAQQYALTHFDTSHMVDAYEALFRQVAG